MPFQKGNQLAKGIGRPAMEIERSQLEEMSVLLGKYLKVAGNILEDKDTERDIKKIQLLGSDMRAILNKLHATKTETEVTGNLILNIEQEVQNKYANQNTGNSIEGQPQI
jgi:hypothetical protein